jgi:DNA repair protein RecN (Recombination protein N)
MITRLYIRNYGIIKEHEIRFNKGLTVITGETGAGKSIVLGAMGLLLGERAELSSLFDASEKCIVEGEYDIEAAELQTWLAEEGFDTTLPLLVRREIMPTGKSRAFINDSPAGIQQLKALSEWLMDISGQHESRELHTSRFQLNFIDEMSGLRESAPLFREKYQQWQQLKGRLAALRQSEASRLQQLDLERFLCDELEQAGLKQADELGALEQQLEVQENALQIRQTLESVSFQLQEAEEAVVLKLQQLSAQMNAFKALHPELERLYEGLHNSQIELTELARDTQRLVGSFEADPGLVAEISSRVDLLNRLLSKHRVPDLEALLARWEALSASVEQLEKSGSETQQLEKDIQEFEKWLLKTGKDISDKRQQALPGIHKQMQALLPAVGLVHAQFKIEIETHEQLIGPRQGLNSIRFLFTANQGSPAMELQKVASGGELSRIMLCLKSLLHGQVRLPSVVFDEIDTGISGETALQVGKVLRSLADKHQVILITHLPQIAAKGDMHLFISKKNEGGRTVSRVDVLDNEGRERAIAQMIAGDGAGETALRQAKELLHK